MKISPTYVRFHPAAEEQAHVLPVANVRPEFLLRAQADIEDRHQRDRNRPQRPQVQRANSFALTEWIEHPVGDMEVGNAGD